MGAPAPSSEMSMSAVEEAGDFFMSLLCAFGSWYNGSGFAEEHSRLSLGANASNASNASQSQVELFARQWHVFLPPRHSRLLQVCPVLGFVAAGLATPLILVRVLAATRLRQQTRFLLLANALLSDLLFLSVYMLSTCLKVSGVLMSDYACGALLLLLGALYMAGILSAKAMVLDMSLAVLAPLRYPALMPLSRTWAAIASVWLMSVLLPAVSVAAFLWHHASAPCSMHICSLPLVLVLTVSHSRPLQASMLLTVTVALVILLLVLAGYLALCWRMRRSVWRVERSARARGTFLIHYLHLFLSFCPVVLLVIELLVYCHYSVLDLRTNLWVVMVICNVLLVLPKALAPYLFGLRYRDLSGEMFAQFRWKRTSTVSPEI